MNFRHLLLLFAVAILSFTCSDDEVTPRSYPRVLTSGVSEITSDGASFKSDITFLNKDQEIIDHGFIWGTGSLSYSQSERISLGPATNTGSFSTRVERSMTENLEYNVCAYLKTATKTILGNPVSFISLGSKAPVIDALRPDYGYPGDTVQIAGRYFTNLNQHAIVMFGKYSSEVVSVTDSLITVKVPDSTLTAESNVSVSILGNINSSPKIFHLKHPEIKSLDPVTVATGDALTISGRFFSPDTARLRVYINERRCKISAFTKDKITIQVPYIRTNTDQLPVQVVSSGLSSNVDQKFTYLKPTIFSIETDAELTFNSPIKLYGANLFSSIRVKLGSQIISPSITKSVIQFNLPNTSTSQSTLSVSYDNTTTDYQTTLHLAPPAITSIEPSIATFNEQIVITGTNFNPDPNNNKVKIAGVEAPIYAATSESLTVVVPADIGDCISTNNCDKLTIQVNDKVLVAADGLFTLRKPEIDWVEDGSSFLVVHGNYFNPLNTDFNSATINGIKFKPYGGIWEGSTDFVKIDAAQLADDGEITTTLESTVSIGGSDPFPVSLTFFKPFTKMPDFPGNWRESPANAVIANTAYVGLGHHSGTLYNDLYKYDPMDNKWTRLADFPGTARSYPVSFALGNYLYVGMGKSLASTNLTDMWRYNTATNVWQQVADFPGTARYNPFVVVDGGKAYVGGGMSNASELIDFWTFNGSTWQQKANLPKPNLDAPSFAIQSIIYTFFGKEIYSYSTATNSWNYKGDYPLTSAQSIDGGILHEFAGIQWTFDTDKSTISTGFIYWDDLLEWNSYSSPVAIYSPETFVIFGELYVLFGKKSSASNAPLNNETWRFSHNMILP